MLTRGERTQMAAHHDQDLKRLRQALELFAEAVTTPSIDPASLSPNGTSRCELEPSPAGAESEGA